jgi:hypothetical protein
MMALKDYIKHDTGIADGSAKCHGYTIAFHSKGKNTKSFLASSLLLPVPW